jgi:hypothetical protein
MRPSVTRAAEVAGTLTARRRGSLGDDPDPGALDDREMSPEDADWLRRELDDWSIDPMTRVLPAIFEVLLSELPPSWQRDAFADVLPRISSCVVPSPGLSVRIAGYDDDSYLLLVDLGMIRMLTSVTSLVVAVLEGSIGTEAGIAARVALVSPRYLGSPFSLSPFGLRSEAVELQSTMVFGALTFAVAHEVAHVHFGDLAATTVAHLHGESVPLGTSTQEVELRADEFAALACSKYHRGRWPAAEFVFWSGVRALFIVLESIERDFYIRPALSHPPAGVRWSALRSRLLSFGRGYDQLLTSVDELWASTSIDRGLRARLPHRKIVRAAMDRVAAGVGAHEFSDERSETVAIADRLFCLPLARHEQIMVSGRGPWLLAARRIADQSATFAELARDASGHTWTEALRAILPTYPYGTSSLQMPTILTAARVGVALRLESEWDLTAQRVDASLELENLSGAARKRFAWAEPSVGPTRPRDEGAMELVERKSQPINEIERLVDDLLTESGELRVHADRPRQRGWSVERTAVPRHELVVTLSESSAPRCLAVRAKVSDVSEHTQLEALARAARVLIDQPLGGIMIEDGALWAVHDAVASTLDVKGLEFVAACVATLASDIRARPGR